MTVEDYMELEEIEGETPDMAEFMEDLRLQAFEDLEPNDYSDYIPR